MATERRISFGIELRAQGRKLSGTVMQYGAVSPSHRERFEPGSLRLSDNCWLDLHHDPLKVVAWHPDGGLALDNGSDALTMRAELPPIPAADLALAEIREGQVNGLSVEFKAVQETREGELRVIQEAVLSGVGIVRVPSYEQSQVEARRRRDRVKKPWIKTQWDARKSGACDCQGPQCETVSFTPGAFSEALATDQEYLALVGSNRPLASRSKGTLAIRETDTGDIEVEIDQLSADTEIGRDLAGQAKATRVVARPWVDIGASKYTDSGTHRTFTRAALKGVIIKPTVADDGWNEIDIDGEGERQAAPIARRRRLWL